MALCQVPLVGQGGGFGILIVPVTTQDKRGLKKELPAHLDDSIGVGERYRNIWEIQIILVKIGVSFQAIFFRIQEKWMILQKTPQLWEHEHPEAMGRDKQNVPMVLDAIPQADIQWDSNNQARLARL